MQTTDLKRHTKIKFLRIILIRNNITLLKNTKKEPSKLREKPNRKQDKEYKQAIQRQNEWTYKK